MSEVKSAPIHLINDIQYIELAVHYAILLGKQFENDISFQQIRATFKDVNEAQKETIQHHLDNIERLNKALIEQGKTISKLRKRLRNKRK